MSAPDAQASEPPWIEWGPDSPGYPNCPVPAGHETEREYEGAVGEVANPPAFPYSGDAYANDTGMTLRDWFAGQALAGRMARNSIYSNWDDAASDAYEMADAMLRARLPAAAVAAVEGE